MPGKKKKFIDKKNAVTFSLVHRSQRDPLQADDESSKFVLHQVDTPKQGKQDHFEEQHKFGIYYEDDYNYMQHLREPNAQDLSWELSQHPATSSKPKKNVHFEVEDLSDKPKLQLPAAVFQSEQEEDIGLLNRAAPISGPRLDLDPDIVAAMDEDFDFDDPDNELDDDFMMIAQGNKPVTGSEDEYSDDDDEEDEDEESGEDYDSDDLDDDMDQRSFASEETKSRFTNYSLTSSVIKRNEGLTLLDDRFEKIYEEYDDMEIGALDQDEIDGHMQEESLVLQQAMKAFEEDTKFRSMNEMETPKNEHHKECDEEEEEDEEKEEKINLYIEEKKEEWDCESILSTYSTLYNHPTTIKEPLKEKKKRQQESNLDEKNQIKLSQKSGMPLHVLPSHGPTKKQLEREEFEENRLPVVTTSRVKGVKESAEEKKERKQAVKLARKERRVEKKANQQVFKDEEKRQNKAIQNLNQNMQGIKIL
ncbi:protein LTV1 homolog [Lytechinus pictus]|uniref:protein LTV1 homolog n=1 Tax=Lytechinus pictus TaxID=7653 RepID=UPI0030B9B7BB